MTDESLEDFMKEIEEYALKLKEDKACDESEDSSNSPLDDSKGNPPNDDLGYTTIETTHPELTYRVPWDTYQESMC